VLVLPLRSPRLWPRCSLPTSKVNQSEGGGKKKKKKNTWKNKEKAKLDNPQRATKKTALPFETCNFFFVTKHKKKKTKFQN
jgi:hypothetical protein